MNEYITYYILYFTQKNQEYFFKNLSLIIDLLLILLRFTQCEV